MVSLLFFLYLTALGSGIAASPPEESASPPAAGDTLDREPAVSDSGGHPEDSERAVGPRPEDSERAVGPHSKNGESYLKPQLDSTASQFRRTKRFLMEKLRNWTNLLPEDSLERRKDPAYLQDRVRSEYYRLAEKYADIPVIKARELLKHRQDSNFVLVDVRPPEERAVSTIARSYSPPELSAAFTSPQSMEGKQVITFDTIGYRAARYARQLMAMGLQVRNLEGGLLAWALHDGPLVTTDSTGGIRETHKLHVFSEDLNFLTDKHQAVW